MNDSLASRFRICTRLRVVVAMTILVGAAAGAACAATSVMIWPIDPVIESDQRAAALWLENRDIKPVALQIRVLGWRQDGWEDLYAENQRRVVSSPPMATVLPGKRQLIRLTKLEDVAPGSESAYRVLVDEIPYREDPAAPEGGTAVGVRFQMHYSIPLFVNGNGVWVGEAPDRRRDPARAAMPALGWHLAQDDGKRWLVLTNRGAVHARITAIAFVSDGQHAGIEQGLLGYVLPGARMRWALPDGMKLPAAPNLVATVNGKAGVAIAPDDAVRR